MGWWSGEKTLFLQLIYLIRFSWSLKFGPLRHGGQFERPVMTSFFGKKINSQKTINGNVVIMLSKKQTNLAMMGCNSYFIICTYFSLF